MSDKKVNVAVAGATGAVGNQMITCLEESKFPLKTIKLLASHRSVGRQLRFRGDLIPVEELTRDSFKGVDIALFSAGGGTPQGVSSENIEAMFATVSRASTGEEPARK